MFNLIVIQIAPILRSIIRTIRTELKRVILSGNAVSAETEQKDTPYSRLFKTAKLVIANTILSV